MKSTPKRPARRPLLAALTLSALLTALVPAAARGAAARPLDLARLEARIAAAIGAPVAAGDVPGVSAAVITRDGAVHAVTAGVARRAPHEKPLTINGKMLSGSIGICSWWRRGRSILMRRLRSISARRTGSAGCRMRRR
jgi:hypothetical protein